MLFDLNVPDILNDDWLTWSECASARWASLTVWRLSPKHCSPSCPPWRLPPSFTMHLEQRLVKQCILVLFALAPMSEVCLRNW